MTVGTTRPTHPFGLDPAALSRHRQCLVLFAMLFFAYAYIDQGPSWQVNSRLDLLHAVLHGTVTIDRYHRNTGDKAHHAGHYYSEKAPGMTVLALPSFAVTALVLHGLDIPVDSRPGWRISRWIATLASAGVVTALGGVALYLLLLHFVKRRHALLCVWAIFLGTLPFPYATALYSHGAVIGLLASALWLVMAPAPLDRRQRRLAAAGALAGAAIACEYPAVIAAGGVGLLVLHRDRLPLTAWFAAAAIPPLLLVPLYNALAFGSALSIGYVESENFSWAYRSGLLGFGIPRPGMVEHLLFSPTIGLFFWCPVLLLALVGYPALWRSDRWVFWILVSVPIATVLAIAGFSTPRGGWALGPRYLAPMIPFLSIPVALGLRRLPRTGSVLAIFSIVLMTLATAVSNAPNLPKYPFPLSQFYLPALAAGDLADNLGSLLGLPGILSLTPLVLLLLAGAGWLWREPPGGSPGPPARRSGRPEALHPSH